MRAPLSREEIAARADLSEISCPLSEISRPLRERALDCLVKGDAVGFLLKAEHGNTRHVLIVRANLGLLQALGIYEKALLGALTSTRTNNCHVSAGELRDLLDMADPRRLRAAGNPLPKRGPHALYRGVAGRGRARHLRGLSWTVSLGVAGWFADRFAFTGLGSPAVLRAVVPTCRVLAYTNDRQEEEYFVDLPPSASLERVPERVWRPELKRHNAERQAETDPRLSELMAKNEARARR